MRERPGLKAVSDDQLLSGLFEVLKKTATTRPTSWPTSPRWTRGSSTRGGTIIDVAVTKELERLEARRFAKTKNPRKRLAQTDTRPRSRYIFAAVRRSVEKRDGGRCTYRGKHGRRCSKRHDLEFHHKRPFGRGGDHSPEGLALMCRTHNALLAEEDFGKEKMARYGRRGRGDSRATDVVEAGTGPGALKARWRSTG